MMWNLAVAYIRQNADSLFSEAANVPGFREKINEESRGGGGRAANDMAKKLNKLAEQKAAQPQEKEISAEPLSSCCPPQSISCDA
jgi:hypothetical protein